MSNKKAIKIPPRVRVGYQDISVTICSPETEGRLHDVEGFYQSSQAQIFINDKQCRSEQFATLVHECLHAIFYTYGMREVIVEKDKEEYVVNTISSALIDMLRNNPLLLEGIKNGS